MDKSFIEIKLFQVKPDKLEQFEATVEEKMKNQNERIAKITDCTVRH